MAFWMSHCPVLLLPLIYDTTSRAKLAFPPSKVVESQFWTRGGVWKPEVQCVLGVTVPYELKMYVLLFVQNTSVTQSNNFIEVCMDPDPPPPGSVRSVADPKIDGNPFKCLKKMS